MRSIMQRGALWALVGLLGIGVARAGDAPATLDELPAAVLKTVRAKYPGAKIVRGERAVEDSQPLYEVGLMHRGKRVDLLVLPEGRIFGEEKPVAAGTLPREVIDGLSKRFGKVQVVSAKQLIRSADESARPAYYSVTFRVGGQIREREVTPDGKIREAGR